MIDISKDVMWVFSLENPLSLPSYIVSGIMPADYNRIQKIIFLKNHNSKNFLIEKKPKVLIIGKVFHSGIIDLVLEAKKMDIKIISIFDDWHFDEKFKKNIFYNLKVAKNSNVVVAKTKQAINIIYKNTQIRGVVIPDCLRYKTLQINQIFCDPYNLCWFGTHTNHASLIKAIEDLSKTTLKINLKIITNKIELLKNSLLKIDKNITLEFIEWTLLMHEEVVESEIIIIPLINNKKSNVKSSNRIIDSLNMGKFVIINDNEQFQEFKDFCYFGNIIEGLEWVSKNKKSATLKIKEGQKYVNKNYSLEVVSNKWKKLILEL